MQVLILRLLSMFLWCPGVPALESELTKYPVSMRQCIIKVMVVFGQYFLQLLKMLPLGARDAHGCLVHLVIVLSSALFFLRLCGGVATGQCSWYCSSPNHPRGIADTVGPQLEDLQHCCLGECCLKIQLREVPEERVVHLFDFIRMVSSCSSYYINVLGWPKYLAPPEFAFNCRVYRFKFHPGAHLFEKFQHPSLSRITLLTESSTTDSRWSKNAWCKVFWLMITYIALFSALLSRLTALACGSTWVTSFL